MLKHSFLIPAAVLSFCGILPAQTDRATIAAANNSSIVDEIVARVNDSIITHRDMEKGKQAALEELKQQYPSDWESKWPDRQRDVLRDLVDRQLLLDKGADLDITGDTETVKKMDELRRQLGLATTEDLENVARQQGISFEDFKQQTKENIITEKVIGQEVGSKIGARITKEDVEKWYNGHQKEIAVPESIKLAEILVSTQPPKPADDKDVKKDAASFPPDPVRIAEARAKANDLLEQLRKGAKFEVLAKNNSDGPTAAQGGEMSEFKRGDMDKQLEDKTFSLKPGETTDVIQTKQGFIIFKILAHQRGGVPSLKDVDERIRNVIYAQRLEPAAREYLTRLREEGYIEIHEGYVDTGASPSQVKPIAAAK